MTDRQWKIAVGGRSHTVEEKAGKRLIDGVPWEGTIARLPDGRWRVVDAHGQAFFAVQNIEGGFEMVRGPIAAEVMVRSPLDRLRAALRPQGKGRAAAQQLKAAMPGLVLKVMVTPGQTVEKGTPLLVLEAMKMENIIKAPTAATIKAIHVAAGQAVEKGQLLISLGA